MRAEDRRAQLVEIARQVFVREGSMAPAKLIADEAGVHEALIFQHFGSKEKLFEAAVMEPLAELVGELHGVVKKLNEDHRDEVRHDLLDQIHIDMLRILIRLVPMLGIALFSDVPAGRQFYRNHLQPVLEEITHMTDEGTRWWRRPGLDAEVLATATYGIHFAYAMQAMFAGGVNPNEVGPRIADLLWLGQAGTDQPKDGSVGPVGPGEQPTTGPRATPTDPGRR
jgi:AcrR family transcriptional regulator